MKQVLIIPKQHFNFIASYCLSVKISHSNILSHLKVDFFFLRIFTQNEEKLLEIIVWFGNKKKGQI